MKRSAQEQHICHDNVLSMCVQTIISMSIARTDLVGDAYNGQVKMYVGTGHTIIGPNEFLGVFTASSK